MKYTFEHVHAITSVAPVDADAGAINGDVIDTVGFGDGMAVISTGEVTGSPDSYEVDAKLQESADGSSGWGDVPDGAIETITEDNKTGEIRIRRATRAASERYIRVVVTPAFTGGSSPTIPVSAVVMLGNPVQGSNVANSTTAN